MDRSRVDDTGQWARTPGMAGEYVAWNGQTYYGIPPDGWYRAGDGRWWPTGTGPVSPTPAMMPPPPGPQPLPPAPGRSKAPALIAIGVVAAVVVGIMWLGSTAEPTGQTATRATTRTTTTTPYAKQARILSGACPTAAAHLHGLSFTVPDADKDCVELAAVTLTIYGFDGADLIAAMRAPVVRGKWQLDVVRASDGQLVSIRSI